MVGNPKTPKTPKKYSCECCNYYTVYKGDFDKHLNTAKHKKNTQETINDDIGNNGNLKTPKSPKHYKCECCERIFKTNSGLWKHNKICINEEYSEVSCVETVEQKTDKELELKDMFMTIVNENKELRSMMIEQQGMMMEQQKTITNQSKQMTEIIPKLGNNTTTNTINNNQKVNINVFLNEKCKDAINMSDFIKSISVTLEQLDFTKTNGLEKGISNVIMENMNKLSLYERPIHCTDAKRETLYIKDNDTWEKDKDKKIIKQAIKKTSNKNYTALTNWTKANPNFMKDDDKQMFYAKAISNMGKPIDGIDDKIVKKLCSETNVKDNLKEIET
jgi:hypothetical protein